MTLRRIALAFLCLLGLSAVCYAQAVPPDADATTFLTKLAEALAAKEFLTVALLGTAVIVWLAEHLGPKVWPVLGQPRASALLALVMSLIVPVINAAAGGPLTVAGVVGALVAGFIAWGGPGKLSELIKGSAAAVVLLAAGALLATSTAGCGAAANDRVLAAVIDCGKDLVRAEVARIEPVVVNALGGAEPDWQAELARLEANGTAAVACTLAKILAPSPGKPAFAALSPSAPASRAARYLELRGWHPINVPRQP